MYATETLPLASIIPFTVCFDAPTKWDGSLPAHGTWNTSNGRAGRRGIDERGFVYILADRTGTPGGFSSTDPADIEELRSRFNLSYNSVLNLNRTIPGGSTHSQPELCYLPARNDKVVLSGSCTASKRSLRTWPGILRRWSTVACPRLRRPSGASAGERKLRYIKAAGPAGDYG